MKTRGLLDHASRMRLAASLAALLFLFAVSSAWAAGQETVYKRIGGFDLLCDGPHFLDIGVGVSNIKKDGHDTAPFGRVEMRIGRKLGFVGPVIGLAANTDGTLYGYGGIYADLAWRRFVLTPVLGIGGYRKGTDFNLGGVIEFREELGFAYRIGDRSRIGLWIAHISNANLYLTNPGKNDIFVSYAYGF